MPDPKNYPSTNIGFSGLLALIFITLKLTSVIDWSWWWVLCPLWIYAAVLVVVVGISLLVLGAVSVWAYFRK